METRESHSIGFPHRVLVVGNLEGLHEEGVQVEEDVRHPEPIRVVTRPDDVGEAKSEERRATGGAGPGQRLFASWREEEEEQKEERNGEGRGEERIGLWKR